MDIFLLAQIIGFIALALSVLAFQFDKRNVILGMKTSAFGLFAVHFVLLGAFTGAGMNILGGIRTHIFNQRTKKKWADNYFWLFAFLLVVWSTSALTWAGPISLLPAIGATFGTIAFWMKNTTHIRILSLFIALAWFPYNFIVGSWPGMAADILSFFSVIIGIIRFDVFGQKENPQVAPPTSP